MEKEKALQQDNRLGLRRGQGISVQLFDGTSGLSPVVIEMLNSKITSVKD
jgi:hypothetical protein